MSILSTLYQGVSGLNSNSTRLEVTGNNIANVNTIGFKASRVNFEEVLGRTVIGASAQGQIGAGSAVSTVDQVFSQGSFVNTGVSTDLAVAGEGFFVVSGDVAGTAGNFYTRAGQFNIDNEGFLSTGSGLRLQGFAVGADGEVTDKLGDLRVPTAPLEPSMTTDIEMGVGLDASTPARTDAFDAANPDATSDFSTSVTVYDSLGAPHQVDVYFRKTADNSWEYHTLVAASETSAGGDPGEMTAIGGTPAGTLSFNSDGHLDNETGGALSVTFANGASAQDITLDFGESITGDGGDGQGRSAQFDDRESGLLYIDQDGRPPGTLQALKVDAEGNVIGGYSNGEEVTLGRVALARFNSPTGLNNMGGNLFMETGRSGEPLVGDPNVGGRGAVMGSTLEQSNVDMAAEFVQMITAQRAYQANSRTISTSDQIYAETVNLKQ
ncbi:MAG: flagellar biosynthesis protein FlgE [Myxococcales bacterium]|nr:flagellar biosynthesis protein FlgE [Myxococcales bacterium]